MHRSERKDTGRERLPFAAVPAIRVPAKEAWSSDTPPYSDHLDTKEQLALCSHSNWLYRGRTMSSEIRQLPTVTR